MSFKLVKLMTTEGCHLCEQALAMLQHLLATQTPHCNQFNVQIVEISHSDSLIAEYGIRIPVLRHENEEIAWPFDIEQLNLWLREQAII